MTKSEENHKSENPEIEMEAIETSIEMVTEPTDVEELFLSEVNADRSAGPTDSETVEKSVDPATDTQAAAQQSDKWAKWNTDEPESKDQKKDMEKIEFNIVFRKPKYPVLVVSDKKLFSAFNIKKGKQLKR